MRDKGVMGASLGTDAPATQAPEPSDEAVEVVCEACGSTNLELDGWDIDKCRACGHWRYR